MGNGVEQQRFKQLREELGLTQSAFAEQLGIALTTADIERGRTRLTGQVVKELLKQYSINPLWLFGESEQKYLRAPLSEVSPKIITLDNSGKENIVLVNAKAAAGYPHNLGDTQWYESLPAFTIPLPEYRNATFRGFQVEGDSMLPTLQPGEWVLGRAVSDLNNLKSGAICVVVLSDSILVKKVLRNSGGATVTLVSTNVIYPPVFVEVNELREVWQVNSKLTFDLDVDSQQVSLQSLGQEIRLLKEEVAKLIKEEG